MAGGDSVSRAPQGNNEGGVNGFVIKTCIFAASGGLLFGYDLGISGGVTSMNDFLQQFFPSVYSKTKEPTTDDHVYCQYDNQILTLFTSSLYLAALVAASFASGITRVSGRKLSIRTGGIAFLIGAIINGIAKNVLMLIIGRLFLGVAIGFANQAIPVYLSEMAPANTRGALNISFQLTITVGVLVANLVNYGTAQMEDGWGWRVSSTLAAVPALFMMVGSVFLPETPNSLIERGHNGEAKKMLQKIRGINDVDGEFQDLIIASEAARKVEHPWMHILLPRYRPQLVICVLIPFFQQFTGMNVIMFYAPVLFKTLGFGDKASLMSTAISGLVNVLATFVTVFSVDKLGRRILFLQGGIQMIICQLAVGAMISLNFGVTGEGSLSEDNANLLLFLICAYVAAFAWSWGPLGWLLPSEICPLEVRPAGQAISVSVNMFFTFIIAQSFPSMLCHVKYGLFFFFTGFLILMTIFIFFFLPETKNVPIEEMSRVFRHHWFWGKYIPDAAINREPKDGVDV